MTLSTSAAPVTAEHLPALADYCRTNLQAFLSGATPSYFAFGLPDGNVHGLAVSLLAADGTEFMQGNRLSLKNSMPLQSTLFAMAEGLAQAVRQNRMPAEQVAQCRVGLTILCEPSLHGTVAEPDLRGVDSQRHMLVVIERNRTVAADVLKHAPDPEPPFFRVPKVIER